MFIEVIFNISYKNVTYILFLRKKHFNISVFSISVCIPLIRDDFYFWVDPLPKKTWVADYTIFIICVWWDKLDAEA